MSILLIALKNNFFKTNKGRFSAFFLVAYFFLFNLLLLSKIGIIVSTLLLVFFVVRHVIVFKKIALGLLAVIAMSSAFYFSYQKVPYFKQRVLELSNGLSNSSESDNNGSTAVRFKIWDSGVKLIAQNPVFGFGTGDVKDVLMSEYIATNNYSAFAKKLNAHNQFIQVLIATGVFGFSVFVLSLLFLFIEGFKGKNLYALFYVIILLIYMIPESLLENQAGTIFFGLFFALLNQKSLHETANSNTILSA